MILRAKGPVRARLGALIRSAAKWAVKPKSLFLNVYFTRAVVRHYCHGRGCEIGPGVNPQTDPSRTYYLDKYRTYGDCPILVDVVGDASALPFASESLDYLFSSHVLEHCPNTFGTIDEWTRALKPGGCLVLRLPHKERTFDRLRPRTPLSHHVEDYERNVGYDDQTHVSEFVERVLKQFEIDWLPEAKNADGSIDPAFLLRHGRVHHHVWTQNELIDVLRYLKLDVLFVMDRLLDRDDSFLVVCRKPREA